MWQEARWAVPTTTAALSPGQRFRLLRRIYDLPWMIQAAPLSSSKKGAWILGRFIRQSTPRAAKGHTTSEPRGEWRLSNVNVRRPRCAREVGRLPRMPSMAHMVPGPVVRTSTRWARPVRTACRVPGEPILRPRCLRCKSGGGDGPLMVSVIPETRLKRR